MRRQPTRRLSVADQIRKGLEEAILHARGELSLETTVLTLPEPPPEIRAGEVTTLRRDVETFGRHATVAFTDDWEEDAARRDFTINALMADPVTGEVFDYFEGLADLEQRHVRFIGDPYERIAEEFLLGEHAAS